jgi:WD40 repeat protein
MKLNPYYQEQVAISTWNYSARVYSTTNGNLTKEYNFSSPQLCIDLTNTSQVISGGADGCVSMNVVYLGMHNSPIFSLCFVEETGFIASGSFDVILKLWNP